MKTIEKDRDPLCVGFYCFLAQPKKFRNPGGSVFIGVFLLLFTYTVRSVFAPFRPAAARDAGLRRQKKHTPIIYR